MFSVMLYLPFVLDFYFLVLFEAQEVATLSFLEITGTFAVECVITTHTDKKASKKSTIHALFIIYSFYIELLLSSLL